MGKKGDDTSNSFNVLLSGVIVQPFVNVGDNVPLSILTYLSMSLVSQLSMSVTMSPLVLTHILDKVDDVLLGGVAG